LLDTSAGDKHDHWFRNRCWASLGWTAEGGCPYLARLGGSQTRPYVARWW